MRRVSIGDGVLHPATGRNRGAPLAATGETAGMDIELRPVTDEDFRDFLRVIEGAFGFHASSDNVAEFRAATELDRTVAAYQDDLIVGTAGAHSFELTLPGGTTAPAAGVTIVTVRGTHRRQGVLRAMMDHQLDDVADRGEPMALLTASEGSIYQRFGYGPATFEANWSVPTQGTTLRQPSRALGRLHQVSRSDAILALPGVYERCRLAIPGAVNRNDVWWEQWFKDHEWERDGGTARFYLLHESSDGTPDGYLAMRQKRASTHGNPTGTLVIDELFAETTEVEAALWQYAIEHDLMTTVSAPRRPVDEAIRWRLADVRRLACTQLNEALWVRPLDIAATLAARRYPATDGLVIEVVDPFRPGNEGRYLIDGGPDGAHASRSDRSADLTLDVADLGSIYMGGVAPSVLARAGRIESGSDAALRRADSFFASSPAPWLTTHF